MTSMLTAVFLFALASGVAAQCTGNDGPACASWKNNGYCTNAASPMDVRKRYCGVTCGFCNRDGTQTAAGGGSTLTACVDANANCEAWVASKNFCARPDYSNSMKLLYCCKTCRPVIFAPSTVAPSPTPGVSASAPVVATTPTPAPGPPVSPRPPPPGMVGILEIPLM